MRINKRILVSLLVVFVFLLAGCPDGLNITEGGSDPPPPELLTTKEFLALSHLDEQPVWTAEEVTLMVEGFIRAIDVGNSGVSPMIARNAEM